MRLPQPLPPPTDPMLRVWKDLLEANPAVKSVTGAYSASTLDSTILCDATAGAFTVTLPPAGGLPTNKGLVLRIKKIDSSVNAVTVDGSGAETIEGSASVSLSAQWDGVLLQSTGSAWIILAST